MNISKRLKHVASYVKDNSNIIDVACDHALLDIYLYNTKKNIEITVSDIAQLPLEGALNNLKKYNITNIKALLGNGLEHLSKEDTIIISGLGGNTITNILIKDKHKLNKVFNIILCPNDNFYLVRKEVTRLGYKIDKEELILDNNKIYLIISFIKGKSHYKLKELIFGKYIIKDEIYNKYYIQLLKIEEYKLKNIPKKYLFKRFKILLNIYLIKNNFK